MPGDRIVANSEDARTATDNFYKKLKDAGESAADLGKQFKSVYAANLIVVKAIEQIEEGVGKGKPTTEQLKQMAQAGKDWASSTGDVADLLDKAAATAKAAALAWNDAVKELK